MLLSANSGIVTTASPSAGGTIGTVSLDLHCVPEQSGSFPPSAARENYCYRRPPTPREKQMHRLLRSDWCGGLEVDVRRVGLSTGFERYLRSGLVVEPAAGRLLLLALSRHAQLSHGSS